MTASRFRLHRSPSSRAGAGPAGRLVALDASAFPVSPTGHLAGHAAERVDGGAVVALHRLDAEALLGRRLHPSVSDAIDLVGRAEALVVATPVYRGTYSGVAKAFFDLLPPGLLDGVPCLVLAVGDGPEPPELRGDVERLVTRVGGHLDGPLVFVGSDQVDVEAGPAPALGRAIDDAVWRLLVP